MEIETRCRRDEENKYVDLIYISAFCPFVLVNTKTFYDTCHSNIWCTFFSRNPMRLKLLASLSCEIVTAIELLYTLNNVACVKEIVVFWNLNDNEF